VFFFTLPVCVGSGVVHWCFGGFPLGVFFLWLFCCGCSVVVWSFAWFLLFSGFLLFVVVITIFVCEHPRRVVLHVGCDLLYGEVFSLSFSLFFVFLSFFFFWFNQPPPYRPLFVLGMGFILLLVFAFYVVCSIIVFFRASKCFWVFLALFFCFLVLVLALLLVMWLYGLLMSRPRLGAFVGHA